MLKAEFEERIGKQISEKDYDVIELVYGFYPAEKPELFNKEMVAMLYTVFGMRIFHDMASRADVRRVLEDELQEIMQKIANL